MSLINREDLIASVMDDGGLQYPRWWYIEKIKTMPEATITGHWDDIGGLSCRCSQCGCEEPKARIYCPNCGSRNGELRWQILK